MDGAVVPFGDALHPSAWGRQETAMSRNVHTARAQEFHNKAAHLHQAAATAHGKGDHLTAHELSQEAHEYSKKAFEHSQEAMREAAQKK
jgi:hypothetical protein